MEGTTSPFQVFISVPGMLDFPQHTKITGSKREMKIIIGALKLDSKEANLVNNNYYTKVA